MADINEFLNLNNIKNNTPRQLVEKLNELVHQYNRELSRKYGRFAPRIYLFEDSFTIVREHKRPEFGIHWKAYGTVDVKSAKIFMSALKEAINYANYLNKISNKIFSKLKW